MRVILWDIDGTLIRSAGAGLNAMRTAVDVSPGAREALRGMRLDGMTDYGIARKLCAARRFSEAPHVTMEEHAVSVTRQEMDALLGQYLAALQRTMAQVQAYEVLAGVFEALDALEATGRVVHALATGNLEAGARLKLTPGNLWGRFHFGGYGSDAEDRPDVLRAAWRRAHAHVGRELHGDAFVVVGDTPRDVMAAHAVGMPCVGVATGRYTVQELWDAGADDVLGNLLDENAHARILDATRKARG